MCSKAPVVVCLLSLSLACVKAQTNKDGAHPRADAGEEPAGDAAALDVRPADAAAMTPDAPPPADADRAPDTALDRTADALPDLPPSPCPGGPPPLDYNLPCGCMADGKIQCDGTCNKPDSTCVPTGQYYFLTNTFLGESRRLDTYNSATADAFMARTFGTSGQLWVITAVSGGYRLTNMFLGEGRSLESVPDGAKLFMGTTGTAAAQRWRIRAVGAGLFRIQNAALGDARSLDTPNDTTNDPLMAPTGNYTGQVWKITKAP
jgi:hypothetical protein